MNTPDNSIDPQVIKKLDHLREVPSRDPAARSRGRANFLAEVEAAAASAVTEQPAKQTRWNRPIFVLNLRTAVIAFGLVVGLTILLAFGGSAVTAYAQTALPGDFLYGLQSAPENAQVTLSNDYGAIAELHLQFAERRIEEIRGLINQGRFDDIELAAREYENHIYRALGAVGLLATDDPARAEIITDLIFSSLSDYTAALIVLRETVPFGQPQSALEKAVNASQFQYSEDNFEFSGLVEAIRDDRWVIGGRVVVTTEQTEIKGPLAPGDLVTVHARVDRQGTIIAREIEAVDDDEGDILEEVALTGVVQVITPDYWTIGGQLVTISPSTEIETGILIGALVEVEGHLTESGSLIAQEIKLVEDGPEDDQNEDNDGGSPDNESPEANEAGGEDDEAGVGDGNIDDAGGEDNSADDNPAGDDPGGSENDAGGEGDPPEEEDPPDEEDPPENDDPPDNEDNPDEEDIPEEEDPPDNEG